MEIKYSKAGFQGEEPLRALVVRVTSAFHSRVRRAPASEVVMEFPISPWTARASEESARAKAMAGSTHGPTDSSMRV